MAKIACLHDLNLKEDSGEMFVCFNDFVTYLQKNHKTTDDLKNIKPSNVHREFNRYNDAIKILDNTVCVRFHSVLRYMFNHSDNLDICRKISVQLTKYILAGKKYGQDKTILQIYESITASKCFQQTDEQMLGCLDNEAFSTPYIHNLYRSSLCLFKEHCKDGKLDNSNAVSSQSPNSQEETNQPAPDNTEEELTEPIQDIQHFPEGRSTPEFPYPVTADPLTGVRSVRTKARPKKKTSPILVNTENLEKRKLDNDKAVLSQDPGSQKKTHQPVVEHTEEELTEAIQDIQRQIAISRF